MKATRLKYISIKYIIIKLTCEERKISASSFLYLFTGCLDLGLNAGQNTQRLPHTGRSCLETTPETTLISIQYIQMKSYIVQIKKLLLYMPAFPS